LPSEDDIVRLLLEPSVFRLERLSIPDLIHKCYLIFTVLGIGVVVGSI
jgi:hypothetical protein